MTDTFVFRPGSRVSGVKPEAAAKELARIRKQRGGLDAESVVNAARPETSTLHPTFEWDDSVAGERYRLIQARTLIRAVQVVRNDEPARSVYAYVPALNRNDGEYDPTDTIAEHVDRFTLALGGAMRYLQSAQERVEELKRAAGDQPEDKVAAIALASQALHTAQQAIRTLQ